MDDEVILFRGGGRKESNDYSYAISLPLRQSESRGRIMSVSSKNNKWKKEFHSLSSQDGNTGGKFIDLSQATSWFSSRLGERNEWNALMCGNKQPRLCARAFAREARYEKEWASSWTKSAARNTATANPLNYVMKKLRLNPSQKIITQRKPNQAGKEQRWTLLLFFFLSPFTFHCSKLSMTHKDLAES